MFSKTKTARRALATMAVAPLLAVSLVGCGDKNGREEPSPEPSQSQESPSQESSTPQGSQTTGPVNADPEFLEFMKNNVSSDYQVLDVKPYLQKPDVGAGDLVNTCPAVIYGSSDLAKDGTQLVSAVQQVSATQAESQRNNAVTVLKYLSADEANAALEQVKQEIDNPDCRTVPFNGTNVSIKPVTNSYGFDNSAGFTFTISGNKTENLLATKGQFLVLLIGDLNEVASDGKKVYDALP